MKQLERIVFVLIVVVLVYLALCLGALACADLTPVASPTPRPVSTPWWPTPDYGPLTPWPTPRGG